MAEFGALSSLGVGSGVLTYDVIDKLRKADEKTIIEPIDKRIEKMEKQEEELNTLVTKTAALKSSILDLSDSVFLAKRTVDISGDDIDITAEDGVPVQEIDITVNRLAKANIDQSKGFATKETIVTTSDTTMTISIDGSDFTLDVAAGTTLEELMQLINDETNGKVTASIFNTGGTDPYSLIIKSAETGADQTIGYSFGGGDFLGMTNVQAPQDAEFVFNGISITRSSNLVDDLVYGMTLTLKQADPSASNHVSIKQDNEAIAESVQAFVDAYNDFMTEITTATKYDKENKTVGIFQGEGMITGLKYGVNNIVLGRTPDGGLPDIGITVDRSGFMSFDRGELTAMLQRDPEKVSDIFAGTEEAPGIFSQLNDFLRDQTIGTDSTLNRFETLLKDRHKRLDETKERKIAFLDTKYQIMAKQFAAYDNMIQQMNSAYTSLQMMVDAMNNTSNK